jgi:large conductance mechanosensitive channel
MPPIGMALKNVNFDSLYVVLDGKTYASLKEASDKGAPVIAYGSFISNCIGFVIVAACVFLMVKAVNRLKRKEEAVAALPAAPTKTEVLLEEIRDLLKKKQ